MGLRDWFTKQRVGESGQDSNPPSASLDYRGDYGDLFMPPSTSAESIVSSLTKEERFNFNDLLKRLQEWHESAGGEPIKFHPEARAACWGTALAKIADHYQEVRDTRRALFFTTAAWNIFKYPVFAYNAGQLSLEIGDTTAGRRFLESYLAE